MTDMPRKVAVLKFIYFILLIPCSSSVTYFFWEVLLRLILFFLTPYALIHASSWGSLFPGSMAPSHLFIHIEISYVCSGYHRLLMATGGLHDQSEGKGCMHMNREGLLLMTLVSLSLS